MCDVDRLLQQIASLPSCTVLPPKRQPHLEGYNLPPDLELFYERCGGERWFWLEADFESLGDAYDD